MADLIFVVDPESKEPIRVEPVSFSEIGVKERENLEQWVINHPELLGILFFSLSRIFQISKLGIWSDLENSLHLASSGSRNLSKAKHAAKRPCYILHGFYLYVLFYRRTFAAAMANIFPHHSRSLSCWLLYR